MAGKKKSGKSAKSRKGSSRGASGKKKGKKSAKSRASSAGTVKSEQRDPDMMDPPAMENLYYIAHGPVDALEIRGFGWSEAPKKKGKKGKKKK